MELAQAERLLGLTAPYGEVDLKKAYRRVSREAHPDRGGSDDAFMELKEAVAAIARAIELSALPPPRRSVRASTGRERDDIHDAAWRRRQHERYGTGDARSPGYGPVGGSGQRINLAYLRFDHRSPVEVSRWSGSFVERRGVLVAVFYPDIPPSIPEIRVAHCSFSFEANEEETVHLDGPVVEILSDKAGKTIAVFADLLSGVASARR